MTCRAMASRGVQVIAEQSSADGCLFFCRYVKEKGSIFMNHSEPIRNARSLGLPKMLILGLQHMFAMFGATVLVPILVQSYGLPLSIQTTLLFAGIGTLFFHD